MDERRRLGRRLWAISLLAMAIIMLAMVLPASASHENDDISGLGGLVYIDDNRNGVWDVGEAGYGGFDGVIEEDDGWVYRYIGTEVTFTPIGSGPDDPVVVESAPFRELEDHEKDGDTCTRQDLSDDSEGLRACDGAFGMISFDNYVTWEVSIEVPEGYELTSDSALRFMTGEKVPFLDFGIAPVE